MTSKRQVTALAKKLNISDFTDNSFSEVQPSVLVDAIFANYKESFGDQGIWWLTNDLLGVYAGCLNKLKKSKERKFWHRLSGLLGEDEVAFKPKEAEKMTRKVLEKLDFKDLFAIYGWRELKDRRFKNKKLNTELKNL